MDEKPGVKPPNSTDDKDDEEDKERILVKDVEDDDEEIMEEAPPQGRGHQVQTPPNHHQADFSNSRIRYAYPNEAEVINMHHYGAGYDTGSGIKQGFINVLN